MITVERTFDYDLIRSFMVHPRVYPHITDDGCGPAEDFRPHESELIYYALVRIDGEPAGVFMFVTENSVSCQVHTCMGPRAWGVSAEAAKEAAKWVFSTTPFVRINTQVPVYNKLAERLSIKAGMTQYGLCPKAFKKNGQLWDIALYGMSKEI